MAKRNWKIYANPDRLDHEFICGRGEFSVDQDIGFAKRYTKTFGFSTPHKIYKRTKTYIKQHHD